MTPATRKYYVRVPKVLIFNGSFDWVELRDVKSLTHARDYVDRHFGGLKEPEIWVAKNGGIIKIVYRKTEGKW